MGEFEVSLGARIRELRKRLGMTQKALADRVGILHHQVISQVEKGKREVKAWELAAIARTLHLEVAELLSTAPPRSDVMVLWRDRGEAGYLETGAEFLKHCREYYLLEKLCDLEKPEELPQAKADNFNEARRLADLYVAQLQLGSQPAASLVPTLENRFGVYIWYASLTGKGSGACARGEFGHGILINGDEAPWRRNYSLAHELFHLLTWDHFGAGTVAQDENLWRNAEKLANAFASQLLLPADAVLEKFESNVHEGQITYLSLIEIAREFDVSTEALLWRLASLRRVLKEEVERVLKDETFRCLDRSTMHNYWRDVLRLPERFVRLAFGAYQRGRLTKSRLAELLDTSLFDLESVLAEYGLEDHEGYATAVPAT
jgi:Zn-dependent peptidase ImmA (M78 family)/DNA-binding XRE family transcriptional regulator